jgi:hypothetical protein
MHEMTLWGGDVHPTKLANFISKTTQLILMKFDTESLQWELLIKFIFHSYWTYITPTLYVTQIKIYQILHWTKNYT